MSELSAPTFVALALAVVVIAFLYSSVGHGGATGYLTVLALAGVAPASARLTALIANVLVAGIAWWRFQRAGHSDTRVLLPLVLASVPCAWLGSRVVLPLDAYGALLGSVLVVAGLVVFVRREPREAVPARPPSFPLALAIGGALGVLSGLTGIGGGVFLSPLIIVLRWVPPTKSGGVSAPFIVLNSTAGVIGIGSQLASANVPLLLLSLPAAAGALVGTRFGVRWPNATFSRVLSIVLVLGGGKLLWSSFA